MIKMMKMMKMMKNVMNDVFLDHFSPRGSFLSYFEDLSFCDYNHQLLE